MVYALLLIAWRKNLHDIRRFLQELTEITHVPAVFQFLRIENQT